MVKTQLGLQGAVPDWQAILQRASGSGGLGGYLMPAVSGNFLPPLSAPPISPVAPPPAYAPAPAPATTTAPPPVAAPATGTMGKTGPLLQPSMWGYDFGNNG